MFDFIKKKKSIIALISILLIIFIVALAFYGYRTDNTKGSPKSSNIIGNITSFDDTITVSEGSTITQEYSLQKFCEQHIGMFLSLESSQSIIKVNVEYADKKMETQLSKDTVKIGEYTYFELPEDFMSREAAELIISLTAEKGGFSVSANNTAKIENSSCRINGDPTVSNIVVDLRTERDATAYTLYWVFVVASMALLIVIFILVKTKKVSFAGICAIVISFFCLVCIFIFPPFTVPDEQAHYKSAYHVSNQLLLDFKDEQNALRMREDDYQYYKNFNISIFSQDYVKNLDFDSIACKNKEIVTTECNYMVNKTVPYLFSATGISIARLLGIGPYWTFQIGRIFNIIQYVILVYFAIKIIPFGKGALAAITLLPITLHISSSVSYDAFTYGGVLVLFAYIIKLIYAQKLVGWKQLLVLALMIMVVIPQKVVYIGVAALLLIIPKDRFAKPKLHFVFKCALGIVAVLSILILQISGITKLTSDTVTYADTAGYSISYVISNIPQILNMLFNTMLDLGDFYTKSIVSYFGWFELPVPWFMIIPYFVIVAIAFMRRENEPAPQKIIERIYAALLFGVVFIFVELLLLIDHTPMGSYTIQGVQGRYFIPALPLLLVATRNNTVVLKKNFDGQLVLGMSVLNIVTFIYCLSVIIPR